MSADHTKYKHEYSSCRHTRTQLQYIHCHALVRAGTVLTAVSGVSRLWGKCCSDMLHSLRAYKVILKAVRTCVCDGLDSARAQLVICDASYANRWKVTHTGVPVTEVHLHDSHIIGPYQTPEPVGTRHPQSAGRGPLAPIRRA
jgi:hypothetical protein